MTRFKFFKDCSLCLAGFRRSVLALLLLVMATAVSLPALATRYRIIDQPQTLYLTPDRSKCFTRAGLYQGDEFDALDYSPDRRMAALNYDGQTVWVSLRYCEEIEVEMAADGTPVPAKIYSMREEKKGNIPLAILWGVLGLVLIIPLGIAEVLALTNLVLFVFKYERLRQFYNKRAGVDFMPRRRWSRLLVVNGGIAFAVIVGVEAAWFGLCSLLGWGADAMDAAGLLGVVAMIVYLRTFVYKRRKKVVGKRQARWETIYPALTVCVLIPVAIWLMNVAIFLAGAALIFGVIFQYVLPGAFNTGPGLQPNGLPRDFRCQSCRYYNEASFHCMLHNTGTNATSTCPNYN